MLFNKPFKEIEYADIEAYVRNKVPESIVLDYKEELPTDGRKIAKLVSAFANTQGGFIIVGVSCDREGDKNRPKEIVGVDAGVAAGLVDRVEQSCMEHITPPITNLPMELVASPSEDKKVFLAYVPESDNLHAVNHNTTVYTRVMSHCKPEERQPQLDKLEWLLDKRRQGEAAREERIRRSKTHSLPEGEPLLTVFVSPTYIKGPLFHYGDLPDRITKDRISSLSAPPLLRNILYGDRSVVTSEGNQAGHRSRYFDCFGLSRFDFLPKKCDFVMDEVLGESGLALNIGLRILHSLEYCGSVSTRITLSGLHGLPFALRPDYGHTYYSLKDTSSHIESRIEMEMRFERIDNVEQDLKQNMLQFIDRLVFAYGASKVCTANEVLCQITNAGHRTNRTM